MSGEGQAGHSCVGALYQGKYYEVTQERRAIVARSGNFIQENNKKRVLILDLLTFESVRRRVLARSSG